MDKRPGAPATLGQLMDKLYDIRPFGGLVIPWVPFGSSGHVKRPSVRFENLFPNPKAHPTSSPNPPPVGNPASALVRQLLHSSRALHEFQQTLTLTLIPDPILTVSADPDPEP